MHCRDVSHAECPHDAHATQGQERKELFAEDARSWFNKAALCEGVGIRAVPVQLPADATFAEVHDAILALNRRADIDAIILERPVPLALDPDVLGSYIAASKDVDNERRELGFADGGLGMPAAGIHQAAT